VFRDRYLRKLYGGNMIVGGFYANLPWLSELVKRDPIACRLVRSALVPSTFVAEYIVQNGTGVSE